LEELLLLHFFPSIIPEFLPTDENVHGVKKLGVYFITKKKNLVAILKPKN
jgi:hypothetical protein